MKKAWYKEGFVYQIYPRSFNDANHDGIGDLQGIIEKIPYLQSLGVDIVWLSPVYMSPMEDNGYDISDYYNIAPDFGTLADMKQLIKALHKAKIRLVMDLVINHTSNQHPWFLKSIQQEGKYKDYYHWEKKKVNWSSFFGGESWSYDDTRGEYYLHLFSKGQPDLNWDNPDVRKDIKEMIKFWLDLGVDGFRCDVINLIAKNNRHPKGKWKPILKGSEHYLNHPNMHMYLHELYRDVFSKYDCFTVGETVFVSPQDAKLLTAPNRQELTMVFQFDHMAADNHVVKWFIKRFKPMNLKKPLSRWQNELNGHGWNTLYLENHDQSRSVSRFGSEAHRRQSATMLATMLYFQQGTPFIYQGQELGMTNARFPNLDDYRDIETKNIYRLGRKLGMSHRRMMKKIKHMSRDNARTPMPWNDHDYAGFSDAKPWIDVNPNYTEINVAQQLKDNQSVLNYYKRIIALRKEYQVITYGSYEDIDFKHKQCYSYRRQTIDETLVVVCNFSQKPLVLNHDYSHMQLLLANVNDVDSNVMTPYEARVYYQKN